MQSLRVSSKHRIMLYNPRMQRKKKQDANKWLPQKKEKKKRKEVTKEKGKANKSKWCKKIDSKEGFPVKWRHYKANFWKRGGPGRGEGVQATKRWCNSLFGGGEGVGEKRLLILRHCSCGLVLSCYYRPTWSYQIPTWGTPETNILHPNTEKNKTINSSWCWPCKLLPTAVMVRLITIVDDGNYNGKNATRWQISFRPSSYIISCRRLESERDAVWLGVRCSELRMALLFGRERKSIKLNRTMDFKWNTAAKKVIILNHNLINSKHYWQKLYHHGLLTLVLQINMYHIHLQCALILYITNCCRSTSVK